MHETEKKSLKFSHQLINPVAEAYNLKYVIQFTINSILTSQNSQSQTSSEHDWCCPMFLDEEACKEHFQVKLFPFRQL